MEIIKAPIYVKLTEEERKTLRDAYDNWCGMRLLLYRH